MHDLDVEIKNFGKISQANFPLKPFTLIAGKNASGKSFITRALYSVYSSLNKDHLSIEVDQHVSRMKRYLSVVDFMSADFSEAVKESIIAINNAFVGVGNRVDHVFHDNTCVEQIIKTEVLMTEIQLLKNECKALLNGISTVKKYHCAKQRADHRRTRG